MEIYRETTYFYSDTNLYRYANVRRIHQSPSHSIFTKSSLLKGKGNRVDYYEKYMKAKSKKEDTKVHEIWPSITVAQLAGNKTGKFWDKCTIDKIALEH